MVFNKIILSATALLAYVTSPSILTLSEAATKCGITYTETFSTFSSSVITDSPLVYPKTDAEIADILDNAGKNKCKVRVKGAGQSEVGIIREYKESSDVVVISLAEYTPIASYNKVITPASGDKSATFKISAGATLLDVISTIRPQGYVLPTSCAGMFFTVGGMYMNCGNHGSTVDSERFCGHVKSLTAVLATGKSVTLTSDKDVKAWRGSMGYLGVVTAVEFEITSDNGIIMALSEFNGTETPYTQVNLNTFWKTNTQTFQAVQWYWNPYTDMMLALTARFNGNPTPFNYTTTSPYYAGLQAQWPDLAKTGGAYNPQSSVYTLINKYYTDKSQAALSATLAYENLKMAWYGNIFYAMDMLYLPPGLVVPFDQVQTYIKCQSDCIDDGVMFDVISSSRTYIQSILGQQFAPWYPTMNLEWRLVTVKADTAVLEFLEPGKYISISFENIRDIDGRSQRHGDFFMGLYNIWQTKGTFRSVHFGKTWAWGKVDGLPDAYPNQESVEVFSKSVKKQFTKLMKKYDKKGLFQAGSILTLLGLGTSTYEPRLTNDKNCYNFKDNQCISGCCCSNPLTCAANFNKCAAKASCK